MKKKEEDITPPPPKNNFSSAIKDAGALVAVFGGVIVFLLWSIGRNYAAGFFAAMNIPDSMASLSIWEYIEFIWSRTAMLFLGGMILAILLCAYFLYMLYDFLKNKINYPAASRQRIKKRKNQKTSLQSGGVMAPAGINDRFLLFMLKAIGIISLIILTYVAYLFIKPYINSSGLSDGENFIIKNTSPVVIISKTPQLTGQLVSGSESTGYLYKNLRLLKYINGKYYLFQEDTYQSTCNLGEVFVIREDQLLQITLMPISELSCSTNNSSASQDYSITPTP